MPVPAELQQFYVAEYPKLVGTLTLYCGDADLARELAQETVVRICRDWERVRDMASPGGWAHRVAINLANSRFRRRAAGRRALARVRAREGDAVSVDPDGADTVAVREALKALPERSRRAVVLRYYAGLSTDEVAAALGVRPGTARSLLSRATASLRELLADDPVGSTRGRDDV